MERAKHVHETHPQIVKRLKRANGHLGSIVAMIEDGRPCLDIAQQLHAVEAAVANARKLLIQDHLDHCLTHAVGRLPRGAKDQLDEFRAITKYL